MLALLWRCIFLTQAWVSNSSSEGRLGSRNKYCFRLLSLRTLDHQKKWLVCFCSVLRSLMQSSQRAFNQCGVNSCLSCCCTANFKEEKLLSLHLQTRFPELKQGNFHMQIQEASLPYLSRWTCCLMGWQQLAFTSQMRSNSAEIKGFLLLLF